MASKTSKPRKSNHKKKAWKHIDLAEIHQYLEHKELDERTGNVGQDLFVINKEGDQANLKKDKLNNLINDEEKRLIDNRRLTKSKLSDAKIYKHLGSTSAVQAFKSDLRTNQKKTPLETRRKSERLNKIEKSIDQIKEVRNRAKNVKKDVKYDLWEEKSKTPIGDVYVDYAEDFEKKPSLLPAVEQPHPGLSYNPDKKEHTDLLIEIGDRKKKEIAKKKKLNKILKEGVDPTVNVGLEMIKEMKSGLFSENESEAEEIESQNETTVDEKKKQVIISDLKRPKSKKALRNAIQERIDKLRSKKRKEKKRLNNDFMKIKHFIKEAKATEAKIKLNKERREQRKIVRMYRPKRLGKQKYTDPEPEFCLEDELHGSLRKINTDDG